MHLNWVTPAGTGPLFAACFGSRWFGVLCVGRRSEASAGVVPILWLSSSWEIQIWILSCACVISPAAGLCERKGWWLPGIPHSWRTQAIRGWCRHIAIGARGALRVAVAHRDVSGLLQRTTIISDFWAISGICPFFFFFSLLVVVGIRLMKAGRKVTHGLGMDPVGRVFMSLSQGIILVSLRAGDPPPWGFLGCPGETEVDGTYSHIFITVTITAQGGT